MQLNSDQQTAVDAVVSGFLEKNQPGLTVLGEGGTGKTTSVMQAVQRLLDAGLKVLLTAPTNKAVKQLEKSARAFGLTLDNVAFQTLHSALGLAMLPNEESKVAVKSGKGVFPLFDVVVVDEASMLSRRALFDHLLPQATENDVKILFMGDDMQLPPVREQRSEAFGVFPTYRLTKVERQAGDSGILTLNAPLRAAIKEGKRFVSPDEYGPGVSVVQAAGFVKYVVDQFDIDTNLDDQRVLAWRNTRVDSINDAIRRKIFGKDVGRFEVGERVVTGGPIRSGDTSLLSTDEECIVHSLREGTVEDEETGELYKTHMVVLNPLHANIRQVIAHVLHEQDEERYTARLSELARLAKQFPAEARGYWSMYHRFKDLFANVRYCYCLTVHRSQGSTYQRAFVDLDDILSNHIRSERLSLAYVAFSRPSKELVINKRRFVA